MAIREEAMNNVAFSTLYHIYCHREKELLKWKDAGGKVVGQLGCDVPDELIIAAEMMPVRVYADSEKDLLEANKYLELAFDPVVRAQFERIVDGTYNEFFDYLAISNSTDVLARIFLYLREIRRVEPEKPVAAIAFIDWLFTRNRLYQERNERTLKRFQEIIEAWAGREIADAQIRNAAAICNENREALRSVAALRHAEEPRISGSEALVIIGAGFFMDKQEHTKLIRQMIVDALNWPVLTGPRIFFTGSAQEDTVLYNMIEGAGCVVVGEDHDWGDRHFERDTRLDIQPIKAIVDRYMLREYSSKKAFVSQRVEALNRYVEKTNTDGVLFYFNVYEESGSWDYPEQKALLEQQGIATMCFAKMKYPADRNEELSANIQAFVQSIQGGEE